MRQLTATGFWPLYRFDPRRADEGKLPLALDSVRRPMRWPKRCSTSNVSVASTPSNRRWQNSSGKMPPPICKNAMTSSPKWRVNRKKVRQNNGISRTKSLHICRLFVSVRLATDRASGG
jgi:hypothetical protein